MKLTTAQLDAMLTTLPGAAVKVADGGRDCTALYHGEAILTGWRRDDGEWSVTFIGGNWTVPAYLAEEDRLETVETLRSSWRAVQGA